MKAELLQEVLLHLVGLGVGHGGLCLPPERDPEVAGALGERLKEREGLWSTGPAEQKVVTLWWDTGR